MANLGALGTLRNACRALNEPSTSALLPSRYQYSQREYSSSLVITSPTSSAPKPLEFIPVIDGKSFMSR